MQGIAFTGRAGAQQGIVFGCLVGISHRQLRGPGALAGLPGLEADDLS